MWTWLKDNLIPLGMVAALVLVLALVIFIRRGADDAAKRAADRIENEDLSVLPAAVVAPARVERASRGVRDQVEAELDEAQAPRPDDDAGGLAAAQRGDDAWRDGIERLRDKASRY